MIEYIPEWAERRCDCGAYLDAVDVTFTVGDEEVCEGCYGAIASVEGDSA